jgi:hypothetical protein
MKALSELKQQRTLIIEQNVSLEDTKAISTLGFKSMKIATKNA